VGAGTLERGAAVRTIEILRTAGHESYLAGGCVRDELLGFEPKDYDVATGARPEQIASLFARTASVGAAFGVMLVRDFGPAIEVATFRADGPYTDSRRPDRVEFSTPDRDARRRDFTINALFLDPDRRGEDRVIDLVGGLDDIRDRVLRAVGDPGARLEEDHLRALRGVRFAAKYALTIERSTARAIRENASALSGVSVERIGAEVRAMMAHPSRARAARLIHELGLEDAIFGSRVGAHRLRTIESLDERADAMTALAAWAHDRIGGSVLDVQRARGSGMRGALDLSRDDADALAHTLGFAGAVLGGWGSMGVAARKRLASSRRAEQGALLLEAVSPTTHARYIGDRDALASDGVGLAPAPLITGDELIGAGFTPGPAFGATIDAVYDAQLERRVTTRGEALDLARSMLGA